MGSPVGLIGKGETKWWFEPDFNQRTYGRYPPLNVIALADQSMGKPTGSRQTIDQLTVLRAAGFYRLIQFSLWRTRRTSNRLTRWRREPYSKEILLEFLFSLLFFLYVSIDDDRRRPTTDDRSARTSRSSLVLATDLFTDSDSFFIGIESSKKDKSQMATLVGSRLVTVWTTSPNDACVPHPYGLLSVIQRMQVAWCCQSTPNLQGSRRTCW